LSHRHQQIEATLKRAVQQVLAQGLSDPRADGCMITVTELSLGSDLKIASIKLSIYPEAKEKLAMHAIRHAAAHLRRQASDLVSFKQMPQLAFEVDHGIKKQGEILDALAKVAAEREARGGPPSPPAPASPDEAGNNPPEAGNP
jgi:ribosome-binding factor A